MLLFRKGKFELAIDTVQRQIGRGENLAANYGLLADVRLTQYSLAADKTLATSKLHLQQAAIAIQECEAQANHRVEVVSRLRKRLQKEEGQA